MDTDILYDTFLNVASQGIAPTTAATQSYDEFSVPEEYIESLPRAATSPTNVINPNRWDPRFVVDIALGIDALPDILERYRISQREYEILLTVPVFRQELAETMRDIRENGLSFVAKAKVQAETYLSVLDALVHDPNVAPSTRLDAIKSAVTWGRLLPKEEKSGGVTSAAQININISF